MDIRNRMRCSDMETESKNSISSVQQLVILFGVIFCTAVAVLLVVLYYPSGPVEKEFDDFEKAISSGGFKEEGYTDPDMSKIRVEDVTRALEDFGAAFLALIAVCCVAVGLTCLVCACCMFT